MSTNDLTEEKITDFVLDTLKQTPEIRTKSRRPASARRTRQRTPKLERVISTIKVAEPTHPLFGKTLKLLSEQCGRGKAFHCSSIGRRSSTFDIEIGNRSGFNKARVRVLNCCRIVTS
jgi:hypothetical protein